MAEVVLFHHIQGLTDGVRALAGDLQVSGHTVHTPDLFEGRTFRSIQDGLAHVSEVGHEIIVQRGLDAAAAVPHSAGLVYGGLSFGAGIAQRLAQTTADARGALLLESCLPEAEFGTWPSGLPAQIHGMVGDEFFAEDLPAARALTEHEHVELYEYAGDGHLFSDPSVETYAPQAYAQMLGRLLAFLASV